MTVIKKGCPLCHQPPDEKFRPFCSHRCKMLDLGNWLSSAYILPTDETASPSLEEEQNYQEQ